MPRPSPFLLHAWLLERWRHYGGGRTLAVHVALRGERVVGALPLCRTRRFGLRVTEFVGGTHAPLADLMLIPGETAATAERLVARMRSSGDDYVDLFGMPRRSRIAAALPAGSIRLLERLGAPVLDLGIGWSALYRARFSSKSRSDRRRRRRRLEALGTVELSVARTRDELLAALDEAFRLHALRWQGRRDGSGFTTPTGRAFHRAAVARLADQDVPRLVTLSVGGRAIAFVLGFVVERALYGATMGFDPAFARFSPGGDALLAMVESAAEEGIQRVEFLGADAPHKRRLTDRLEPIHEGIGLPSTARGRAAVEALVAGIRARQRLKQWGPAQKLYARVPRVAGE